MRKAPSSASGSWRRWRARRGLRPYLTIAATAPESGWTRSELERRFLALCIEADLPRPRVNAWVAVPGGGFEVDFSWPRLRLIVEADGHESHGDRRAFEEDRRRDQLPSTTPRKLDASCAVCGGRPYRPCPPRAPSAGRLPRDSC